jgi:hypothetical protein
MWWPYWFHRNSIFLWISTKISIGRRFWSNGPMDWLQICWLCWSYSSLGLNEENFRDFKDFDVCLLLNCTLLPTAVHDSTVYRYSTLADQTVHFDNNYTQNHHPVPFAPVPVCGGHQICCQANFTVLVILIFQAVAIMMTWLHDHRKNPYPLEEEKELLLQQTKITINQLNYWFTNARRRIIPKWATQETNQFHHEVTNQYKLNC